MMLTEDSLDEYAFSWKMWKMVGVRLDRLTWTTELF